MAKSIAHRCDQCEFWDKAEKNKRSVDLANVRECKRPSMFWDATEWSDKHERVLKSERLNDMMFVQDGSDYMAELLTRADFFCAHFKQAGKTS